jgi:hypothetical protein
MSDYVPRKNSDFDNWQAIVISCVQENLITWDIPEQRLTDLQAKAESWHSKYVKTINRQDRTSAEVRAKDDARRVLEYDIRKFIAQYLAHNDKIRNSDRELMGLTIRSGKHTPVPVPISSPVLTINFSVRLQHTLTIVDNGSSFRRSKPKGVLGCQIWVKIDGEPPKEASELMYISVATRSTYVINYEGNKTGKVVYYWVRWINSRQQAGPWSALYSAVIG